MPDRARIPRLSLVLGFGPMLLLALAAAGAWLAPAGWRHLASVGGWLWGCAILCFLAGAERGMSFRMDDSSERSQVASALALFALAFAAFLAPPPIAFALLACGYGGIGVVDRGAARRRLAPPHFAALRPAQAAIAVVSLLALLVQAGGRG